MLEVYWLRKTVNLILGAHVGLQIKLALPTDHNIVWILLHSIVTHLVQSRLLISIAESALVVLVLKVLIKPVRCCTRTDWGFANPSLVLVHRIEISSV